MRSVDLKSVMVEVVHAIECDCCGRRVDLNNDPELDSNNLHSFSATGGYGTTFPCDMCGIQIDVCSTCLEK